MVRRGGGRGRWRRHLRRAGLRWRLCLCSATHLGGRTACRCQLSSGDVSSAAARQGTATRVSPSRPAAGAESHAHARALRACESRRRSRVSAPLRPAAAAAARAAAQHAARAALRTGAPAAARAAHLAAVCAQKAAAPPQPPTSGQRALPVLLSCTSERAPALPCIPGVTPLCRRRPSRRRTPSSLSHTSRLARRSALRAWSSCRSRLARA